MDFKDWDFSYSVHKNKKGTHFDLRLYCPSGASLVYSWSAKKDFWKADFPIPVLRTKDHPYSSLVYEETIPENTVKILYRGVATLLDAEKNFLLFKAESGEVFSLKNLRGKRYLFNSIK